MNGLFAPSTAPVATPRDDPAAPDEYAWLRDRADRDTILYLEAENAHADAVLAPTAPLRQQLFEEMVARIRETDVSVPVPLRGYEYYRRFEKGMQYPVHARRRRAEGSTEEVLLDLNAMADGHSFMALGAFAVSDDDALLAYSTDDTGFRQYRLMVRNLTTGERERLVAERVTSVAWVDDSRTLLYVTEDPVTKRGDTLWRQAIGGEPELVLHEDDEAFSLSVRRTRSREWLVLTIGSHTTSECRVLRASAPRGLWRTLMPRRSEIEYDIEHHSRHFLVRINDTGRNFRIARMPVEGPSDTLEEIVAHDDAVMIEDIDAFAGHIVLSERIDGIPQLHVHQLESGEQHRVAFPEASYDVGMHANPEWDATSIRIGYESFVTPTSIYDYDLDGRTLTLLKQEEVLGGYNPTQYVTERTHATAADGTRIPISLVRRFDVPADGTAPGLLTAYGAYGYPYSVSFSSSRVSLLDRGIVFGVAHIRGGGDLGKAWHDAGRMQHKMNTFTDFIACAAHLQDTGRVAPGRLAIEGGSAGGLLMGAVTNLRPDLFAAVVTHVPFVDVVTTMSDSTLPLTVGEYEEWGNPAVPAERLWMEAYDPYRNLRAGEYPAMLVRTAINDSQVMYWEPAKYVARLRRLRTNDAPLLLLTNMGAGHGGASGRYERFKEIATDQAFLLVALGVSNTRE
ncbi:MAG: S9 family peptidase [Gemmatimonadales bacterium]|nr:S9 family peptidase [Gemmatimonadales bacterium]